MNRRLFSIIFLLQIIFFHQTFAQFPPQFPLEGNDAIDFLDARIVDWADRCTVIRGYIDILDPSLGRVEAGEESNALGIADGMTVSLGDSGIAIIEFDVPIINDSGPDFVIFENGFANPLNNQVAFLELAFVEVSNNGIDYYRFPAVSLLQIDSQYNNDSYLDAREIHNLAGKYIRNQGTPFDLEDLKDEEGLDLFDIRYIRIIDVVGIIDDENYRSYDSEGTIINDPYPTPFPTGGFDLDAIGVINNIHSSSIENLFTQEDIKLFPNPTSEYLYIELPIELERNDIEIYSINGKSIQFETLENINRSKIFQINTQILPAGLYLVKLKNIVKSFIKQ